LPMSELCMLLDLHRPGQGAVEAAVRSCTIDR
jgi:hypothetical protein